MKLHIFTPWLSPSPLAKGYGVHTSRITPLNPPLVRGEIREFCSLPFTRGGLGRGKTRIYQLLHTTRSGESTVFESNAGTNPPQFAKGQQVKILYIPDKPNSATIDSWVSLWLSTLILTGLGSIFALVGGSILLKSFPALRQKT
ncbi:MULTISPECIES: DUF3592 domain-containing protein [Nostoc]|uniref:DUF3592 domain-containing protein n=1 Tax=Nostoc paludosum FACHB-159 TaxID=2692908 RepID=A0ABR8K5I7_9NOSO|nr:MULTISPECIES: DUF3592 domain-containing protein [Nostoc]MBD2677496.1 DUF3592 domain-containing protein [Nostoc sp. FACHB-857]MBD2734111.1 DUF3592 domain-containing protein [Nostoc paludosum FACHB-159]